MSDAYQSFVDYRRDTSLLLASAALLGWDQEACMPPAGVEIRAGQLAQLRGLAHRRQTAAEYGERIERAAEKAAGEAPDSPVAANLREARREYDLAVKLPAELVEELTRTTSLARGKWVEARKTNEFRVFLPWLEKILDLTRQKADALGHDGHPYDALLDQYEPGETTRAVAEVFSPLREMHVDLVGRILDSGRAVDTAVLHRRYAIEIQREFARAAAAAIGFDFERGRIDVTTHPFCSGTGPTDVRLTTRYTEDFFNEAFFGALHEAGHGIYEQGLSMEHFGTPMGEACSLGIHESQSRLWENLVGRSRGFWRHFFPKLQEAFPAAAGDADPEAFYAAINDVRPSFIRVEADEVTYNLHIFLRFELEQDLITGDLAPADVPDAWNGKFKEFLQITPPDDSRGCLQDIHWSLGLMGYFATYALGNLYAAQIYERAQQDLGDLQEQFARGEFTPLREWLNEKVHRQGKRLRPRELVAHVTGHPPSHEPLARHLAAKYGEIYGLKS